MKRPTGSVHTKKKRVTVKNHVPHLHANGSIHDHAARALPINSVSNPSRKAHLPVISSFKSSMYFFTLMSEYTWIVIHDHTIIEAINEMGKCMSLTKNPPPIVINAAMIVSFFGRRRSYWCLRHILSRAKIKRVLPFNPAQYVQKSDVDLCMICQKKGIY